MEKKFYNFGHRYQIPNTNLILLPNGARTLVLITHIEFLGLLQGRLQGQGQVLCQVRGQGPGIGFRGRGRGHFRDGQSPLRDLLVICFTPALFAIPNVLVSLERI